MEYEARRDMIDCAFRAFHAKDIATYLKKQEKRFGPILHDAYGFAYEVKGTDCMAVCFDRVDEMLSEKFGWKTIQQIRREAFEALKSDIDRSA